MYDFYTNQYGGSFISQADFKRAENKARSVINHLTFNRIDWEKADNNIKMCLCELAEHIIQSEKVLQGSAIASETVGEHSVSYAGYGEKSGGSSGAADEREIVSKYLLHTGLMYRG